MLRLLFLSISSLPFFAPHLIQTFGRKKHVIQNKYEGERSVFPGQKEITTYLRLDLLCSTDSLRRLA